MTIGQILALVGAAIAVILAGMGSSYLGQKWVLRRKIIKEPDHS